jgi:hypothetical protein
MEMQQNTSGQGSTAIVPEEIKGWNWGAFFLNWIWSVGNQVWIGLLALIPCVSLIMAIVLGIKGSEWAWQNKKWESVEQFQKVQKTWAMWGLIIFIASFIIGLVSGGLSSLLAMKQWQHGTL